MIVNEIAKLENALQARVELLLVAQLGELLLVTVLQSVATSPTPPREKVC